MSLTNLKNLATLMAGHPLRGSIENAPDGDIAVVQMKDVNPEGRINLAQLYRVVLTGRKNPDYLCEGDILFVGRGYRIFSVLVERDLDHTVAGPHFFIIRVKAGKALVRPDYLTWYLNHKQAQRYFSQHVAGTALPHINRSTLEDLPIVVPPLEVQARIVKAHYCHLKEKALLEKLIVKKRLFLDGLLDKTLEQYQEGEKA
jgi:Type I restriction modification DNA specificity domain